jgi:hypothetical protein
VRAGGVLLAPGETGFYDGRGAGRERPALESLPVEAVPMVRRDMRGAYFQIGEGELPLPDTKVLMLDGRYYVTASRPGTRTLLKLLPPQRFGPPELCFPEVDGDLPGVLVGDYGSGKGIYLPWHPDAYYYRDSLPDTRTLVADLIGRHVGPAPVKLEGKGALEVTAQRQASTGRLLVHVINYGGQRNNLYEDPAAVHGLRLGVRGAAGEARALVSGATIRPEATSPDADGYSWYALPPVETFEAVSLSAR